MHFRLESMDWQQRLAVFPLIIDDIKSGKTTLKLLQGTTEFGIVVFNDKMMLCEQLFSASLNPLLLLGEPPSKKAERSPEEYQSLYAVDTEESKATITSYYGKLLEAPPELPKSTGDL